MDSKILGLRISGTIFGLISLLHLLRILFGVGLIIGDYMVPIWLSVPAFFLLAWLSLWMWKLSVD